MNKIVLVINNERVDDETLNYVTLKYSREIRMRHNKYRKLNIMKLAKGSNNKSILSRRKSQLKARSNN